MAGFLRSPNSNEITSLQDSPRPSRSPPPSYQAPSHVPNFAFPRAHTQNHWQDQYSAGRDHEEQDERAPLLRGEQHHEEEAGNRGEHHFHVSIRRKHHIIIAIFHFLVSIFLFLNASIFLFTALSITHSSFSLLFLTTKPLFLHRGSTFLPLWLLLLGIFQNLLSLIPFRRWDLVPFLAKPNSLINSLFTFVILIVISANSNLRHVESGLTLTSSILSLLSGLISFGSHYFCMKYLPRPSFPYHPPEENPNKTPTFKQMLKAGIQILILTFPLILIHFLISFLYLVLLSDVIIRSVDTGSVGIGRWRDGNEYWKVNPWMKGEGVNKGGRGGGGIWMGEETGFRVHLNCLPILNPTCGGLGLSSETDDSSTNCLHSQYNNLTNPPSTEYLFSTPETRNSFETKRKVTRTILAEPPVGYPGRAMGDWVHEAVKEMASRRKEEEEGAELDVEARVCYWDRPGLGLSDNSHDWSLPVLESALFQALSQSGEFSRLLGPEDVSASPSSAVIPEVEANSGIVLLSTTSAAPLHLLFASRHPHLIHSHLLIDPHPPTYYYHEAPSAFLSGLKIFFVRGVPGFFLSGLGIGRWGSLVSGLTYPAWSQESERNRKSDGRVWSISEQMANGMAVRSRFQKEADRDEGWSGESFRAVNETVESSYPGGNPHIVLSTESWVADDDEERYRESLKWFLDDVIGRAKRGDEPDKPEEFVEGSENATHGGLVEWRKVKWGDRENAHWGIGMCGDVEGEGYRRCSEALEKLLFRP